MTRAELERIYDIGRIIRQDEEALERLRASLYHPGHQNLTGMPGGGGDGDRVSEGVIRLDALISRIEAEHAELERIRAEVYAFCMEIEDIHIRGIVADRFFNLCEWREVARRAGGGNTEDSVSKAYYRWAAKAFPEEAGEEPCEAGDG